MSQTTDVRRVTITLPRAGEPSPAAPVTEIIAVEEICPSGAEYHSGPFPHLILYQTLAGSATVTDGGPVCRHTRDCLIAVASGSSLTEQVTGAGCWHCRYVLMRGAWADQISRHLRDGSAGLLSFGGQGEKAHFEELFGLAFTQGDGWQWRWIGLAAFLCETLWAGARVSAPGDRLVTQVAARIDAAPDARPTVAELAGHVGLSPRQLLYEFRKATGEPIAQWIRKRRIATAQRLLEQGLSVTSVAARLGYANPYHFSRQFKAITGMCPSAVSERARRTRLHS